MLPAFQRELEDCVRKYCSPARVECVWIDVMQSDQVRDVLYPAMVCLWDQCGVLVSPQRAELRQALADFKRGGILEHLVDISSNGYTSGRVLPLVADGNTPFITCGQLTTALGIDRHAEWRVLLSQLEESGDIVILHRGREGQLGRTRRKLK